MLSSSLHINICCLSILYILVCFPRLCISTAAVPYFCIFDFAFFLSAYWHLQFFSSVCLTWFTRPCLLLSPVFAVCIFHFTFFVFAYWLLQYFSSLFLKMLRLSLHYEICGISFLYTWLCFPCLCILTDICSILVLYILFCFRPVSILTSAVFQFCIFQFAFLVSACKQLQYFSSAYLTLLASSLHIHIYSISFLWISFCFDCLCILKSAVI